MARNLDLNVQLEELPKSVRFDSLKKLDFTVSNNQSSHENEEELVSKVDLTSTVTSLTRELRYSFTNGMSNVCESYVSTKLKAKFRNIARDGRKNDGQHAVRVSKYGQSLTGFSFNSENPYHEVFKGKYFVKQGSNRGHIILHFPAFIPMEALKMPKGATHFKLYNQLVALSDFEFDEETGYRPVSKNFHGKKSEFYSQMLPILKIPTQAITAQLSVNNGMGVPDSSGLLLIMGVHFYQYENCKYQPMSKESSLEIIQAY